MRALAPILSASLLLLLAGCPGTLTIRGNVFTLDDDDTAAGDDDDTAAGDDDDVADDDDITPPLGGPVLCGPEVSPTDKGVATSAYTGDALITFDFGEARGGAYNATWTGCEAKHFFDADGDYTCGVLWAAEGTSYGEQIQPDGLVTRFAMEFTVEEETCGAAHPDVQDYERYFRVTLTAGDDGLVSVTWSENAAAPPASMQPWVTFAWDGDDRPDEVGFEYSTEFEASSN